MGSQNLENKKIEDLKKLIDPNRLPYHIAIIMNGNGRWAAQKNLARIEGHKAGIKAVREAVEGSCELGIKVLTLYTFSLENWKRPKSEVDALMDLMVEFLYSEIDELNANQIRLIVSGRSLGLPEKVLRAIEEAQNKTKDNQRLILNLAFNYSGRAEIVDVTKRIIEQILQKKLNINEIDEEIFRKNLYNSDVDLPYPDLLIRTSGELRISNFLLWQIAYTELYFTPVLWPDFTKEQLFLAILDYQKRKRRFGSIEE